MADNELRELFSKNLRSWLNERGKTQADLRRHMDVSSATASDWCNGRKIPRTDKIQAICSWLGLELKDLLTDQEPEQPGYYLDPETAAADPEPEPETTADPEPEPEPEPARDPKAARGPVPEKTFVGQTIRGNGWQVYFDGDLQRTRIIFDQEPTPAAKKAVQDAGFYYSGQMKSWNKKLTFKAYRAAKVLSDQLSKIYAA